VRETGEAEAAIIMLRNEAQNRLGSNVIDFELAKKRIETMPAALGEMVKPIGNLKDVRILHTGGAFSGNGANGANVGFGKVLAGELFRVPALKPPIDEILAQSAFKAGDDPIRALTSALMSATNGAAVMPKTDGAAPAKE
jgi:flotillin